MSETYRGVPLPERHDTLGETEMAWWECGVAAALAVARPLIENLTDDETCARDHHGYCQTHWGGASETCANAEALEFLQASAVPEPEQTVLRAVVSGASLWWHVDHRPAGLTVTEVLVADVHPTVRLRCVQCGEDVRRG